MKDHYTLKAKKAGMRARSAYKLLQLNKRYGIIKKGSGVLDLGCWPGGWLIAAKKISKTGRIVGIDLTKIVPVEGVEFIQGDINKVKVEGVFDVVMSDMAPKTTGIHKLDVDASIELAYMALKFAEKHLKGGGNFIVKVFQGEGFDKYLKDVKKHFQFAKTTKPEASRKRSKEVYIVGFKFLSQRKP